MSKAKYWKLGDKYAGITSRGKRFVVDTLSKAKAKIGRSTSTTKRKPSKKAKKRSSSKTTSKKKKGGGGRKLFGNVGFKGVLVGTLGMALVKIGLRRFVPQVPERYVDPVGMITLGAIGKAVNLPTKNLLPAGVITGGSTLVTDLVMGQLPMFGFGRNGGNSGGYDL